MELEYSLTSTMWEAHSIFIQLKDTGDLTQFNTVACREYTLPREEAAAQPKGWIQGNTKIGPVLEVATRHLHGKHGVESKSLNVEQTHDRTGRPGKDTAAVQDDSQVYHEPNMLNVDEEVLRERMEKSIVVHDENHEPMMVNEADMDFKIPGLPHSIVKHAQKCQRSRIDSEN